MKDKRALFAIVICSCLLTASVGCEDECTPVIAGDVTPPGEITDLTAISLVDSTILLTWTSPGDDGYAGIAAEYEVRYQLMGGYGEYWPYAHLVPGVFPPKPAGSPESLVVYGLIPERKYIFALASRDEAMNWSGQSYSAWGIPRPYDITGRWVGAIIHALGPRQQVPLELNLTQHGTDVTGTFILGDASGTLDFGVMDSMRVDFRMIVQSEDTEYFLPGEYHGDILGGIWTSRVISTGEEDGGLGWGVERFTE
jgi:hypothetical protein